MNKPWFLRSKKLGDYSHLRWQDFNELRAKVSGSVNRVIDRYPHCGWGRIKDAALRAIEKLAEKHHCTSERNTEGGHICIYRKGDPVFALRIGSYSRHRV